MAVIILGIESSCDDTGAAIIRDGEVLSNVIANQEVHRLYGGVVPELASRAHQENIIPVVHEAIKKAGIARSAINGVAITVGPGLAGPLMVGTAFAKSFAQGMDIPIISVNHMQAHVLAHFIEAPKPDFPFICLTVSGGHTQIVLVNDYLDMEVIGQTNDDAAGEAFDKTAKILGLPYPGGPLIDKYAARGNPDRYTFPEPNIPGLDFSFSGLKTAILYFVRDGSAKDPAFIEKNMADICASVQQRIISIVMNKLIKAAEQYQISSLAIAGGVSANSGLRRSFEEAGKAYGWQTYIPRFEFCTDNAGMIAMTGYFKYLKKEFSGLDITPDPRYRF